MFGSAEAEHRTGAVNTHGSTLRQPVSRRLQETKGLAWLLVFWHIAKGCFGATQTDIVVAIVRLVPVADGARQVVWLIVPRATPQHALCAPARNAAPI